MAEKNPHRERVSPTTQIVRSFFDHFPIAHSHIENYNWFVHTMIHEIIAAQAPVAIRVRCSDDKFYDYFTMRFGAYYLSPPTFDANTNTLHHRRNGTPTTRMYPNDARLHNLTYAGNFGIDVHIQWHDMSAHSHAIAPHDQPTLLKRVFLGKMPIMLHSDYCATRCSSASGSATSPYEINECPYDMGGYFIINGNERVILAQEYIAHNQLLIHTAKSMAEYRSTSNDTMITTNTLVMNLSVSRQTCMIRIPYVDKELPLIVVLYAMGWTDVSVLKNNLHESIHDLFDQCVHRQVCTQTIFTSTQYEIISTNDYTPIQLEHASLLYVANLCSFKTGKDIGIRIDAMRHKLFRDLFTNIPLQNTWSKTLTLLWVFERLARAIQLKTPGDDIDHKKNRRVYFGGSLLAMLFRNTFIKIVRDARISLQRDLSEHKKPDFSLAFKWSTLTHQFNQALATGNWFHERPSITSKTGITQQLNRQCGMAAYSLTRRINNTSSQHDGKSTKARALHSSSYGYLCPCKSPDGHTIGQVVALALFAIATISLPRAINYHCYFKSLGVSIGTDNTNQSTVGSDISGSGKIFMNGALIGYHSDLSYLERELRKLKRNPQSGVHAHTSIELITQYNELHVRTDGGRFIRPLVPLHLSELTVQSNPITNNLLLQRVLNDPSVLQNVWHNGESIEWLDPAESSSLQTRLYFNSDFNQSTKYLQFRNQFHPQTNYYLEVFDSCMLGLSPSFTPFLQHNQLPRNMYHAAISDQVISVPLLTVNERFDTQTHSMNYLQKPLAQTVVEEALELLPSGQNAIVAIMCYDGYNTEDSIIMCRQSIQRGFMNSTSTRSQRCERRNYRSVNEEYGCGVNATTDRTNNTRSFSKVNFETGIPALNTEIVPNDVLIAKTSITYGSDGFEISRRDSSLVARHPGAVDDVYRFVTDTKGNEMIRVRTRRQRIPEVGDKFSSRHGQKGVIGELIDQWDMPFNPHTGMTPDILVNPHGYPSRMTIGQLRECLASKAACFTGSVDTSIPIEELSDAQWKTVLKEHGFDSMGREQMYNGRTGEPMEAYIFMGPVYMEKLCHMVWAKHHARSHGPVQLLTRQPVEGKAQDGGIRIGEMERDVMVAYGVQNVLNDRIMSDAYQVWICRRCSTYCKHSSEMHPSDNKIISVSQPVTKNTGTLNVPYCHVCKSSTQIIEKTLPYASKLFTQEVKALGIEMKLEL